MTDGYMLYPWVMNCLVKATASNNYQQDEQNQDKAEVISKETATKRCAHENASFKFLSKKVLLSR